MRRPRAPWWVKAAIQTSLSAVPGGEKINYWLQEGYDVDGIFRQGLETYEFVRPHVGADWSSLRICEVGVGRFPCQALVFWLKGARNQVLVDIRPLFNFKHFATFLQAATRYGFADSLGEVRKVRSMAELLERMGADYEIQRVETLQPPAAFDLVLTTNVLEHIRKERLPSFINDVSKLVKPGGLFYHRVDFADHFHHFDPRRPADAHYATPDWLWAIIGENRIHTVNRVRPEQMEVHLLGTGLTMISRDVQELTGKYVLRKDVAMGRATGC